MPIPARAFLSQAWDKLAIDESIVKSLDRSYINYANTHFTG